MVRRGDDHSVDVVAIQHPSEIARAELGFLFVIRYDILLRFGDLGLIYVAQRDGLRFAGLEHVSEVAPAHAAAADQPETNAVVGTNNPAGRGRSHWDCRASGSGGKERTARCSHWNQMLLSSLSDVN